MQSIEKHESYVCLTAHLLVFIVHEIDIFLIMLQGLAVCRFGITVQTYFCLNVHKSLFRKTNLWYYFIKSDLVIGDLNKPAYLTNFNIMANCFLPEFCMSTLLVMYILKNEFPLFQRSLFRTFLMKGFHFLVWFLCVRGIKDTQCGFKLLTREAAILLFSNLHVERWLVQCTFLWCITLYFCVACEA